MANKAISELPQAQNVNNQDLFVLEQGGLAKKLPAETFITEQGIINALAEALDGHGGIQSVTLSSVSGRIRTYRITFTDQSATTFQVYDGTSIDRISRTSSSGLDDVYTIFLSDGTTTFFTVHNGADGTVSEEMLNDALKDKAPAVTETTESSAIANFTDGADDMPIQSLVAEIEPIQDLTYGDPYPAGSKNQLIFKTISGNIESNGKIVSTTDFHLLVAKVTAAQTYISSADGVATSSGALVLAFFSSEPEIGSASYDGQRITTGQNPFVAPIDGYVAIRVASSSDVRRQIEAGSTATAYYPYSNICPITGWTGCNVTRTGKNLLDASSLIFTSGIRNDSGAQTASANSHYSSEITVKGNTTYTLSGLLMITGTAYRVYFLTNTKGWISRTAQLSSESYTFTTNAECGYIQIQCANTIDLTEAMLELGSTATTYESYQGNTVTVNWTTEAGTVYGGTIDVATGLLTVDRAYKNVSLSNFDYNASINCLLGYASFNIFNDAKAPTNNATKFNAIADAININSASSINGGADGLGITTSKDIYLRSSGLTSKDEYLAAFPNGINVVYELATAQTYQLTPQQLMTLYGNNSIWADVGNVSVTYVADTKMFIEKLTMPTEDDMTADHAISSGTFFMLGNNLYLATAAIASGATIIEGTNATRLSLADALNRLS